MSTNPGSQRTSAKPFGDKLLRSLEYLGFKARNHNAAVACDSISRIVLEQQKYALFREMFPNEWRKSRASFYRAGRYTKYSERANEVFDLVNEKCFPLLGLWHDDPEAEFERFAITPLNLDLCCEEIYYEELRISYAAGLLFYFREDELWEFFSDKLRVSASDFPEINNDPHPNVWKRQRNSDVLAYSELIRLVDHSTGNPWLDSSHCQYSDWYEWDKDTIDGLTEEYRAANKIFERLAELDDRIQSNPKKALTELITFWNEGRVKADKPRQGVIHAKKRKHRQSGEIIGKCSSESRAC